MFTSFSHSGAGFRELDAMDGWAVQEKNAHYRGLIDWKIVRDSWVRRAADIPQDAVMAGLGRDKASHRGIAGRQRLTTLLTASVNQDFLDEICSSRRWNISGSAGR